MTEVFPALLSPTNSSLKSLLSAVSRNDWKGPWQVPDPLSWQEEKVKRRSVSWLVPLGSESGSCLATR